MGKIILFILMASTLNAKAAAPMCEDIFNGSKREEEFRHYKQTLVLEDFRPQEQRLAYDLIESTKLGTEKFLTRYKELQLLLTNEVALSAPPTALLQLTASSLTKKFEAARVKSYLGVIMVQTKGALEGADRTYRIAIPHRVMLALTELAISSGKSPGEIAITYSENLKNVPKTIPTIDALTTPADQALAITRAAFASPSN